MHVVIALADRSASSGGQAVGLVILLALSLGIVVGGIKARQTKAWEVVTIGSSGLLIGSTALGGPLRSMYGALGSWLISLLT